MITEDELVANFVSDKLARQIVRATGEFHGQIGDFYEAVGMIVVGRLVGWRVMRLVSSRKCWSTAMTWFGDPKELMPERGHFAYKSVGLAIVDRLGGYWDFISGRKARDGLSLRDRKMMV